MNSVSVGGRTGNNAEIAGMRVRARGKAPNSPSINVGGRPGLRGEIAAMQVIARGKPSLDAARFTGSTPHRVDRASINIGDSLVKPGSIPGMKPARRANTPEVTAAPKSIEAPKPVEIAKRSRGAERFLTASTIRMIRIVAARVAPQEVARPRIAAQPRVVTEVARPMGETARKTVGTTTEQPTRSFPAQPRPRPQVEQARIIQITQYLQQEAARQQQANSEPLAAQPTPQPEKGTRGKVISLPAFVAERQRKIANAAMVGPKVVEITQERVQEVVRNVTSVQTEQSNQQNPAFQPETTRQIVHERAFQPVISLEQMLKPQVKSARGGLPPEGIMGIGTEDKRKEFAIITMTFLEKVTRRRAQNKEKAKLVKDQELLAIRLSEAKKAVDDAHQEAHESGSEKISGGRVAYFMHQRIKNLISQILPKPPDGTITDAVEGVAHERDYANVREAQNAVYRNVERNYPVKADYIGLEASDEVVEKVVNGKDVESPFVRNIWEGIKAHFTRPFRDVNHLAEFNAEHYPEGTVLQVYETADEATAVILQRNHLQRVA